MGNESYMGVKKVFLTWEDINLLLDKIHEQVGDKVSYVTGIPRGGTILAILYSHRFEVQYMERLSPHYPSMLVIDDIADSGVTLKKASEEYPQLMYATLHYKEGSIYEPTYYSEKINKDYGWIVYPWEKESANPIQDYLDN